MNRKRNRRKQKRKEEIRGYLAAAVWGLLVGIAVTFASMAMKVAAAAENPEAEAVMEREALSAADLQETDADGKTTEESVTEENDQATEAGQMTEENDQATEAEQVTEINETAEPVIIIDPGHGGVDDGCVFDGVVEKDINKIIACLTAEKLRKQGYSVKLARKGDEYVDKEDRADAANSENAILYVSIHQNSCDDISVNGVETWYDGSNASRDSKRLAQLVQQETVKSTGAADRGLIDDQELCVTSKTNMPACLIETGFLSNGEDRQKLNTSEYREQIAEGIANGIDLYLNPKTMYLTFDDGPSAENTDKVLDVLKERNIKATFFVIGEYVRKYPETAKRIVEEGHTIGIHCDVHDYGSLYASADSYIADFEKAYETVLEVTGAEAKLFRFPGGSVNAYNKAVREDIITEMESRGFIYYDWNASLEDAAGGEKTPEELIQNAKDTTLGRMKVVLLAHDRVENTALAMDALIDAFPEYQMEPLTEDIEPVQFN